MNSFKPWDWLALQRRFYAKPKQGFAALQSGTISFAPQEISQAKQDWQYCQQLGLQLIAWEDPFYPKLLAEIYDPPLVLLAKGKVETLTQLGWMAVVGARRMSRWGREKTKEIVSFWLKEGFGIVSGLAYGIDSTAHQAALDGGGVTWGILGSSLDKLYPARHQRLASHLEQQGGLLSEFPLGTGPEAYHFPQRNRIISGMAEAVVIVEAAAKSGSLITARFALEQGRDVYVAVPPNEDVNYEGNIRLLEEGAIPFGGTYLPKPPPTKIAKPHWLMTYLKTPQTLEVLMAKTHQPPQVILAALTQLESLGEITKTPGPLWQNL